MKALITGASSGIGLEMAKYLASKRVELILVSRDKERLEAIQKTLKTRVTIIVADLSNEQKVKELYTLIKKEKIDILINNAGFGKFGNFTDISLSDEIEMINTNVKAVHILTKLLLKDMEDRNKGYILNVASSAAFQPGPLMATYYATKSYVYQLTEAIYYEEKKKKKDIKISVLCPGPVKTNFNNVAGVKFAIKQLTPEYVAKYAIDNLLKDKFIIIPGFKIKLLRILSKITPDNLLSKMVYKSQKRKDK